MLTRLILFGRDLIGMIFTSILAEVKVIKSDDDFMTYLPERLTYNGGSMNICKKYIGCHNHFVTKLYIQFCKKKYGHSAMEWENCLCKLWACYFKHL